MQTVDWLIVILYVLSALAIGVYFSGKANRSSTDFFVAGRSLHWFVAGTSMVATTFSSGTPLLVAGITRSEGINGNWFWWSSATGIMASVFFFARLWRRTEAVTEVEFVALRYGEDKLSNILRIFKALFDGILINAVIMASVTLAMSKIIVSILDLSSEPLFSFPIIGEITPTITILLGLAIAAFGYTIISGLYGVVYTDLGRTDKLHFHPIAYCSDSYKS
ncbi:hypothetical protein MLD52_16595 [Puniceicoccaceae bacterium K14]|nr:hypothetical protein [Puniceicoccaceae bacterium K14]